MFPETPHTPVTPVPSRKLWFGFAGSAASWVMLGVSDILISWVACTRQEQFGVPGAHPAVTAVFAVVTLLLFLVAMAAGITSYRNWRALSGQTSLLDTRADNRREFLAFMGIIVSVSLGMGILWLALPPLMLDLCWRAR